MAKDTWLDTRARRLILAFLIVVGAGATYLHRHKPKNYVIKVNMVAAVAGKVLAQKGRDGIAACTSCHGENGEGNFELGYPRLAGLHPKYIAKQLHDFARDQLDIGVKVDPISRDYEKTPEIYNDLTVFSPGIRMDAMMNPIAQQLTDEEIDQLANYYGSLPYTANPEPVDFQTLERGQELALRGKPEYLMPRCEACHGPNGEGFGEHFPPLAGQPPQYLIKQINKWQNGERDNDQMAMMKNTANLMTDGDKVNVARYYSNRSYSINAE